MTRSIHQRALSKATMQVYVQRVVGRYYDAIPNNDYFIQHYSIKHCSIKKRICYDYYIQHCSIKQITNETEGDPNEAPNFQVMAS